MDRIAQEFYCASSGGGCGGYITVSINMALNGIVEVICPKCDHHHCRYLKDGVLLEEGRFTSSPVQDLCPTSAAWSEKSRYPKQRNSGWNERDAIVITEDIEILREKVGRSFLSELWYERFGGRLA